MKKVLFFLSVILLSLTSARGQTNVYHPFPNSNVYWNEIDYYLGQCVEPNYCKQTLSLINDTVINSQLYHKIYATNSSSTTYHGGLRENNKRIYYIDPFCSHEILLYDFNLGIGDSILIPCMLCDTSYPMYMKITSIDSILLNDMTYRKRINFDWGTKFSWIEGIGSQYGLLYPYYLCITCLCWEELVCYKQIDSYEQKESYLYLNESHVPCFNYYASVNEFNSVSNYTQISPNPFTSSTQIYLNKTYHNISLDVYNIQGKLMLQKQYTDCNQIQLNRNGLGNGMYFLKLTMDDRWVETGKIIVSE
jgi:hypothetical protein